MTDSGGSAVALVTGAARGIGFAVARALAAEKMQVIVCDSDGDGALAAARALGSSLVLIADVRSVTEIGHWLDDQNLVPDVLVNNAAVGPRRPVPELDADILDQVMSVNFRAPTLLSAMIGRRLAAARRPGAIINVSSVNALRGQAEMLPYNASKAALISATQTLAVELARWSIRVNAILPGSTDTEIWKEAGWSDAERDRSARQNLMGRLAAPGEIAAVAAFLASPAASFITGQAIIADGGLTVRMPG